MARWAAAGPQRLSDLGKGCFFLAGRGGGTENCCRVPSDSHFSIVAGCHLDGWQGTGSRPEAQPVAAATAHHEGTVTVTVNFLCQLGWATVPSCLFGRTPVAVLP